MKYLHHILIAYFFSTCVGCSRLDNNIFDETPAERMNNALQNTTNVLTAAPSGWLMEYYATPDSSGYPILVRFMKNGQTVVAAQNEFTTNKAYQTDSSVYSMKGDEGPVLTFNSYNSVLHAFSTPENPDGIGLNGDYEFIVKSTTSDTIRLQGKKRGSTILLSRLASNTNWKAYIEANNQLDNTLLGGNSPKLTLKTGNVSYYFSKADTHIFKVTPGTSSVSSFHIPFIVTQKGIKFYSDITLNGKNFRSFNLNADQSALVSNENSAYKITGIDDLALYFLTNVVNWKLTRSGMSASFQASFDQLTQYLQSSENAQNIAVSIKYSSVRKSYVLSISYSTGSGYWDRNLDMGVSSSGKNSLTISYKSTGDEEALKLYNNSQALKDIVTNLSNIFTLSTAASINPQTITLTKNGSLWVSITQ